ncbi:Hypothetical predicted protein, partial [Pelobates cultripes]
PQQIPQKPRQQAIRQDGRGHNGDGRERRQIRDSNPDTQNATSTHTTHPYNDQLNTALRTIQTQST